MSESTPAAAETTPEAAGFPTVEEIREALKEVIDPELGFNIVDLGLVYEIRPDPQAKTVEIDVTLTSPGCPLGPEITSAIWMTVKRLQGVQDCKVNLVWKPMWDPTVHASEDVKMALGIW
jgi:metal-sulfur cluster biosynthetic enzyme